MTWNRVLFRTWWVVACILFSSTSVAYAASCVTPDTPRSLTESGVSIALSSEISTSSPDSVLAIKATMRESSGFPIRDGVLTIRVVKDADNNQPAHIIDSFTAISGIDINPNPDTATVRSFTWRIPRYATHGTYRLYAYLNSPLIPFLPALCTSAPQSALTIFVATPVTQSVFIDESGITVNKAVLPPGSPIFIPDVKASTTIEIPIANPSDVPYEGTLSWNIYARAETPISPPLFTASEDVRIHPQSSTTIRYTLMVVSESGYYVKAQLKQRGISEYVFEIPAIANKIFLQKAVSASHSLIAVIAVIIITGLLVWCFLTGLCFRIVSKIRRTGQYKK